MLKYLPDCKIYVVEGEDANMKLTYKEDFYLIEKLFQLRMVDFQVKQLTEVEEKKLFGKVVVILVRLPVLEKTYLICVKMWCEIIWI